MPGPHCAKRARQEPTIGGECKPCAFGRKQRGVDFRSKPLQLRRVTLENSAVTALASEERAADLGEKTPRKATRAEIAALARALSQSFAGDPFVDGWLVRDDERKATRREHLMRLTLQDLSRDLNETYTLPGLPGCAVWKRPGEHKLPPWRELLLIPGFARVSGVGRIPELLRVFAQLESLHAKHAPDTHYYLHIIGVSPEHQCSGVGTALMAPMMARFDAEGVPAYLETFKERNVPFYERHGFRVVDQQELDRLPTGWFMRRDPQN